MSVSFIQGPAGSGKTYFAMQEAVCGAEANRKERYLFICPDQYTMQMQSLACDFAKEHATSNLEVLSFGRLALRVFDEANIRENQLLNDTGKNLIIQSIISEHEKDLLVLGGACHKLGSVARVKSVISEFMQYGIGEKEIKFLIEIAEKNRRKRLAMKLKDLALIYCEFVNALADRYETGETRYSKLAKLIKDSDFVKGAHLVFDGFTGFTPIQEGVVLELIKNAASARFTLLCDGEAELDPSKKEDLFYLSANTKARIEKLCAKAGVSRGEDIKLPPKDENQVEELAFLKNNLFRTNAKYEKDVEGIRIVHALTARQEVSIAARTILECVKKEGMAYRDIAIVSGDLAGMQDIIKKEFEAKAIPYYLDSTTPIFSNMLLKAVRNLLEVKNGGFEVRCLFAFIRSLIPFPTVGFELADVDRLENFCLKEGIRYESQWNKEFFGRKPLDNETERNSFEYIRKKVVSLTSLITGKIIPVKDRIKELYNFLIEIEAEASLRRVAIQFETEGDYAQAEILSQIYRQFCKVLEQIYDFCTIDSDVTDFADMLSAALSEIRIGTIPQVADQILVGDIERTRIPDVKVLIFLGVNDGNVPSKQDKSDVLSEIDRMVLEEAAKQDIILSPSPRELMFRQRLYLYMIMSKPATRLLITYSERDTKGESPKLPSYLIGEIKKMLPLLKDSSDEETNDIWDDIDLVRKTSDYIRKYNSGELSEEDMDFVFTLSAMASNENLRPVLFEMLDAAFHNYIHVPLGTDLAVSLYGGDLAGSVSAFTMFTQCQYKYFLNKGLKVRPRDEMIIDHAFTGTLYHEVMELVAKGIIEDDKLLSEIEDEELDMRLAKALAEVTEERSAEMLETSAKNRYLVDRCARIAKKSLYATRNQMRIGSFKLFDTERPFEEVVDLSIGDGNAHTLTMKGVIDRVDVAKLEDKEVIRVIDYKSSEHVLDQLKLTHGLNLQLPIYMYEMLKTNPSAIPAAMLYFTLQDPFVEAPVKDEAEYAKAVRVANAMKGIINNDARVRELVDPEVELNKRSKNVEKMKSENIDALSYSTEGIIDLCEDAINQCKEVGESILSGNIEVNPYYITEKDNGCNYCEYSAICEMKKEKKKDLWRYLKGRQEEEEE